MHAWRTNFPLSFSLYFNSQILPEILRSENKMNRLHVIDGRVFSFFLVNNWTANFGFNEIKIHRNIDVDETRSYYSKSEVLKRNI